MCFAVANYRSSCYSEICDNSRRSCNTEWEWWGPGGGGGGTSNCTNENGVLEKDICDELRIRRWMKSCDYLSHSASLVQLWDESGTVISSSFTSKSMQRVLPMAWMLLNYSSCARKRNQNWFDTSLSPVNCNLCRVLAYTEYTLHAVNTIYTRLGFSLYPARALNLIIFSITAYVSV